MHPRLAAVALYSTASSTTPSFLLSPSPATKLVVTRCSIRVVLLSSLYTLISSPSRALASLPTSPMRKLRKSASCCCRPCVCPALACFLPSRARVLLGFSLLFLPLLPGTVRTKLCVLKLFFFAPSFDQGQQHRLRLHPKALSELFWPRLGTNDDIERRREERERERALIYTRCIFLSTYSPSRKTSIMALRTFSNRTLQGTEDFHAVVATLGAGIACVCLYCSHRHENAAFI